MIRGDIMENLSIAEISEIIENLNDDDFYDVMMTIANEHNCSNIDQFGDWIKQVLLEIEENKNEDK